MTKRRKRTRRTTYSNRRAWRALKIMFFTGLASLGAGLLVAARTNPGWYTGVSAWCLAGLLGSAGVAVGFVMLVKTITGGYNHG